jgi:hypothetical protein
MLLLLQLLLEVEQTEPSEVLKSSLAGAAATTATRRRSLSCGRKGGEWGQVRGKAGKGGK